MKIKKIQQSAGVTANVVNSLDSDSTIDALSAAAGKELNEKIQNAGGGTVIIYEAEALEDRIANMNKAIACFEDDGVDEYTGYPLKRLKTPIIYIGEGGTWESLSGWYDGEQNIYRVSTALNNYESDNLAALTLEPDSEYNPIWLDIIGDGRPKLSLADNLTSTDSRTTALSANQGRILNEKVKQYGTYSEEEQEIGTFMGKTLYRRVFHGGGESNYIYFNEGDEYLDLYTFSETKGYIFHFFPVKIDVTYFMYDSDIVDQCGWYSGAADNEYDGVVTPIVTFDRADYGSAVALRWDFANTANKMIGDVIITVEYTREDWGSFGDWNMPG